MMQTISPNIFVKDLPATIKFYEHLGFKVTVTVPDTGDLVFAMMTCGQVTVMFQTFTSIEGTLPHISRKDGGSLLLYINIKNLRTFFDKIKGKTTVLTEPEKTFYGATEFSILDNNNYMLTFAEDE